MPTTKLQISIGKCRKAICSARPDSYRVRRKKSLIEILLPGSKYSISLLLAALTILSACTSKPRTMFTRMDAGKTNISFENHLEETEQLNVMQYEYLYNGGGVSIGDINNDGLADIYFTGNTVSNKLYLNKGNFVFEDITEKAGVAGKKAWKTGVSMADVNGDGLLDIYVCYSGLGTDADRANELFINNGSKNGDPPVFSEEAAAYGVDAAGTYSTQAAFFDYDNDGDLDMFLLNHSKTFYSPFFNTTKLRNKRHPFFGNKLYRNDGNHFVDVSVQAGIYGSGLNFGLGIAITDINSDGYADIYVSNDYDEQDFLYLNNRNGTFTDCTAKSFGHLSKFSMGNDVADINNDNLPDIVTLDMLPEDNHRQKLLKGPDEYDKYQLSVDSGYLRQQMRNMLQLHQGFDKDNVPLFSEIGQLSGISNTDWSWSALLADYDNDGYKDLFITNGYLRDFTNQDFLKFDVQEAMMNAPASGKELFGQQGKVQNAKAIYELVKKMPSTKVGDYMFRNNGDLTFENVSEKWGLNEPNVTTGAAYADLDNDGDLDLITNYTNEKAGIYRNNSNMLTTNHYLKVRLKGNDKNSFAIGAKVYVETDISHQFVENYQVRGYQSSVDPSLHFGLGSDTKVQQLKVKWPGGKVSIVKNIRADTLIELKQADAINDYLVNYSAQTLFTDVSASSGIGFVQHENNYVDFKTERLALEQLSRQGPKISKADVNNDGLEDFFIGGPAGQSGVLYIMQLNGSFLPASNQPWQADKACEDIGSVFFDADGDGDIDLYIVSGGSEFAIGSPELQDRLYINDGKGNFTKAPDGSLHKEFSSGGCVAAADYDKDGDIDLFVGGRINPGSYPLTSPGGILRNDTDPKTKLIKFTVATNEANPALREPGMVTDAVWTDIDNDNWPDLIITGEWMPVKIFHNNKGKLEDITDKAGLSKSNGLWYKIIAADIDKDGDMDFVVGNMGLNTQFTASLQQPLQLYTGDFSGAGKNIPVVCNYIQGKSYPIATLDEIQDAIPAMKKKFLKYANYADASIGEMFSLDVLNKAKHFDVYTLQSSYIENKGSNQFVLHPLPLLAQFSVVQGIIVNDFTNDGKMDILLSGNFYPYRVQYGPCDASMGLLLAGNGKGNFKPVQRNESGILIRGDVRDMIFLNDKKIGTIVISKNSDSVQVIKKK